MTYKYLKIIPEGEIYKLWNPVYKIWMGEIRRARMGQWMHWQLYFSVDFMKKLVEDNQELGFTNGCLKEISKFITTLYSKNRNKKKG